MANTSIRAAFERMWQHVVSALGDKADTDHDHAITDITNLQSALDGKAASSHGTHVSYSSTAPVMDGTASVGSATTVARSDHKHPTDTSRAAQSSLDSHTGNTTIHITSAERTNWNAAKTHADSTHAPSNAQPNQNAFSNVAIGSTTIAADSATDTLTLAGSNVTLTADTTNDKVTIEITKDNVTTALGYTPPTTNTTYSTGTASVSGLTKLYTGTGANTDGTMTQAAIKSALDDKSDSGHTHTVDSALSSSSTNPVQNKIVNTALSGKAPTSHASTATTYGAGTGSNYGHVKLSDSTSTTSGESAGIAATPTAVKTAYDLAAKAQSTADSKAAASHGNHVPATETANNAKFLRNDNSWATVTPANIGAATSGHTHSSYVNQNAFSNVKVGSTTVAADTATDTLTIIAGSNVTITPDATNDAITIASSYTDTNTAHSHSAGVGLTGSGNAGTSGTYTYKAKLRSETALTVDSAAATTTSGRVYPVAVDKTGYLAVNVPWTDTNTTYETEINDIYTRVGNNLSSIGDLYNQVAGKAPTSHASSAATYGVGTTANYGHVKTVNGLTTSTHSNGLALSAYQGYVLNNKFASYLPLTGGTLSGNIIFDSTSVKSVRFRNCSKESWNVSLNGTATSAESNVVELYDNTNSKNVWAYNNTGIFHIYSPVYLSDNLEWKEGAGINLKFRGAGANGLDVGIAGAKSTNETHALMAYDWTNDRSIWTYTNAGNFYVNVPIIADKMSTFRDHVYGQASFIATSDVISGGKGNYQDGLTGVCVVASGNIHAQHASAPSLRFYVGAGTTADNGRIYMNDDDYMYFSRATRYTFDKQIYSTTSTIGTSDRNKKKDFKEFDERYENLFFDLKPQVYKFKDGTSDRFHSGFISQDVEESMLKYGLDSKDFAGYCKEVQRKVVVDTDEEYAEEKVYDEDGNPVYDYMLRYEEFIALNTHMLQKAYAQIDELREIVNKLSNTN